MEVFKCNLYIIGEPGIGKTTLVSLIANANQGAKSTKSILLANKWIIETENAIIEVSIIESRDVSPIMNNIYSNVSSNIKNIVVYMSLLKRKGWRFFLSKTQIDELTNLAKKVTVVFGYALEDTFFRPKTMKIKIKKPVEFIEYYVPIYGHRLQIDKYAINFVYILKQIIINLYPMSLEYVNNIIRKNFQTKDPVLDLGNCGLVNLDLIEELFRNTHIKKLILSNEWGELEDDKWVRKVSKNSMNPNVLFSLPKKISELKNLEILIAGGNWENAERDFNFFSPNWYIDDIRPISYLNKLKVLNLSNNRITSVRALSGLSNLIKLYLNNNLINSYSFSDITEVVDLEELYISNNKIGSAKFLLKFPNLRTVDLHSNQIKDITPIKTLIYKIGIENSKWAYGTVSIANNPLSIPPIEIIANGNVMSYFSQLEAEMEIQIKPYINNDIKLILVGNSNVGKSTYVDWIKTGKIDKGIATTHWLRSDMWVEKRNSKTYNVRIFDFGGQEYYHDTHHLFFTNRTAYVLLWEKSSNKFDQLEVNQIQANGKSAKVKIETFPLEYWLDSIRYHTQKRKLTESEKSIDNILKERESQMKEFFMNQEIRISADDEYNEHLDEENILVLQNKVDLQRSKSFINEEGLKRKYNNIYNFEEISLYNDSRLDLSKDLLFDIFDSIGILNRQYLGTWNYIKEEIEKGITSNDFERPIQIGDFADYCNNIINRMPELKGKSQNQINKVLFSVEDTQVFVSFLSDIGMCLYYPENESLKQKVFLNQRQILNNITLILLVINKENGEITINDIKKNLKESFSDEIVDSIDLMLHFKILFKHPIFKDSYVAPLYLPIEPPKSIILFQTLFGRPVYRFRYETFIHKSIILDFFHEYGSKALSETANDTSFYYWRNGIVIKDQVTGEIVMVSFTPGSSNNKSATLDIYTINSTNNEFVKKIVEYIDSINHGIDVTNYVPNETDQDFVPLYLIRKNEREHNQVFYFNDKYYKLTAFKNYLNSPLKMKKIFISYSKQDLRLVNKFIEHLSALQRDGIVSHWYCSELDAGSVWNDEIQKHLDDSDIICFMISSNFMRTNYIHEHEIKRAFEKRDKNQKFRIVPIILNFCRWTTAKYNLGQFTALPYTAKPVADFANPEMAWYIIEECLRLMIDNDLDPTEENFYTDRTTLPPELSRIFTRIVEGKVDNNSML